MNDLYEELMSLCNNNSYTDEEISLINDAYKYALTMHQGMKRKNGEPYISHPLTVAIIVAKLNVDATTVIAALLHETILHGDATYDDLEKMFGKDVRNIVSSLDKVNRLHLIDDSEQSSLYLRKVLVALSEDVRVIILKLAGRVHNLRTNEGLEPELQRQKALETWNVLIPIAHRLGINEIKSELEDLSFKYLKPDTYIEIENNLPAPREELNLILNDVKADLIDMLKANDIKFEIKGRVKSVSSIHNKLSNGKKWNEIYDILGLRIICEEVSECYLIIGLIHSMYRPIPKRFKDYIAMPKGNSYQSLHTGIFGPNGFPIEVQVRTKEMNEIAEHGVASHWSYKEKGHKQTQSVMEQKLQMFRNIIDVNSDEVKNDDEFAEEVSELLKKSIYVYTPKGDVVELPSGSTPIDFAYRIHSKVGDTTVGAIVNNNIVTLNYELHDNDIVKIMTNKDSKPNLDWLNYAKTTQAKSKIKSYFSKKSKDEYIERGKNLLEVELRKQKISISDALNDEHLEKIMNDLHITSLEDLYLNIGSLRYTPFYIVNLIYEDKKDVKDLLIDKIINNQTRKVNYKNDIIVSGYDDILVTLASCCKPIYGDDIIGYITKGQGIMVHKSDCNNMRDITNRLINVSWNEEKNKDEREYISKLLIYTNDLNYNLLDIVTVASAKNVVVTSLNELHKNKETYYDVMIKVKNKKDLDLFIDAVSNLNFVKKVVR